MAGNVALWWQLRQSGIVFTILVSRRFVTQRAVVAGSYDREEP
jgi:hypothetical protein